MSPTKQASRPHLLAAAVGVGLTLASGLAASAPVDLAPARPRIGLVLGGGGAKGAAHIGVLRILDELQIPVDCVAGTSMGALIGATFAAGTPPGEIEKEVLAINWAETVGGAGARDRMPIQRKLEGVTYTNNIELGLQDGQIRGPGSLLNTQGIEEVLRSLVVRAAFVQDFDQLPIPFRAVATDMQAGERVVLDSGYLPVAMRASMAVPGAFAPVVRGNEILSDGGMMDNLPVDIARDMCADVVIAVALVSPPPKPNDLMSLVGLAGRSIDVMIDANQKAQLATLTPSDVAIVVQMGDIGSADFDKVPKAIPLGRTAANAQRASLARYSLPKEQYLAWRSSVERPGYANIRVASVEVTGLTRVNPDYVRTQLRYTKPGESVTPKQLSEDTSRVFSLGDFESVGYRLSGNPAEPAVNIRATEKSWGPDYLRFDLGLSGSSGGDVGFAVYGDFRRTWMNAYGGEWQAAAQLGQEAYVRTAFYQPVDVRQRFFVEPGILARRNLEDIYADGDRIAVYSVSELSARLDLGMNIGTSAELRAGLDAGKYSGDVETGSSDLPQNSGISERIVSVQGRYDTRDTPLLATDGSLIVTQYLRSIHGLGGEESYSLAQGLAAKFYPWRGDALGFLVAGGARLDGEMPAYRDFAVGGIRTFPGLQPGQLRGQSYWQAGSSYLWKLADIQSLFGQALYAGLRLNVGRMSDRLDEVDDSTIFGAAVSLGGRTPVGPGLVSLGAANNGFVELQIALGRPLWESSALDLLQ